MKLPWPESVTVISTADLEESPHVYSTHHRSLPGLWAMFRRAFPNHHTEAVRTLPIAVYLLNTAPTPFPTRDRRAALFNLVCSMLGYTEGQSTQTLILTRKAEEHYAIRENSSLTGGTSEKSSRRNNSPTPNNQQAHEKHHSHSHDGQVLSTTKRRTSPGHYQRRSNP